MGKWARSTVCGMLKNETYAGTWHYGTDPDTRLSVEVPAIVSREVWETAQVRKKANQRQSQRNTKYEYLMGRRVYCGSCGLKMASRTSGPAHSYCYYVCPAPYSNYNVTRECNARYFRADYVDATVWDWLKSFLTDPDALTAGLWEVHQEREKELVPLRERLAVVDNLITDNRSQLERLLDLYLSGEFPKDVLTDRKSRLETTILGLERERAGLAAHLEEQVLSVEQIQSIQELAAKVGENLEAMGDDFGAKRGLIEAIDVWVTLVEEDGEKVVYTRCIIGEDTLSIESKSTGRCAGGGGRNGGFPRLLPGCRSTGP